MVGMTPIIGLIGMLLGMVIGFGRGLHHGWLAVLVSSSVGAVVGLFCGCVWALLMQWCSDSLHRVTKRIGQSQRVLADVVYWCGFVLMFIVFMSPFVFLYRVLPRFH